MERFVIHVVHSNSSGRWHLKHNDTTLASFETKAEAFGEGQAQGNKLWDEGNPAQLVIHREDGSIEREYTYGKDPERHPG
jgi:hypothetical protein